MSSLSFLSPPVLARLREAGLITGEECRGLSDISDVVRVQSGKSDYVIGTTAVILMDLGFKEESTFLAGEQTKPSAVKFVAFVAHWNVVEMISAEQLCFLLPR